MHNLTYSTHKRKINKVAIKANNRIVGAIYVYITDLPEYAQERLL